MSDVDAAVTLRDENLRFQLLELLLHLRQLRVGLFDDEVDVGDALLVPGNLAQVLRPLLDFELLLDLPPNVFPQLLQFLRQGRMRQMGLNAILDAQLVQKRQAEVVIL